MRRRTGYLPEERGLYPKMRVAEHLVYLGRLYGLAAADARRRTDRLQRVQLAAALVHDPELLVLDEPFSGLDPLAVDTRSAMLRRRAEAGAAVVFSSHQLDLGGGPVPDRRRRHGRLEPPRLSELFRDAVGEGGS